MNANPYSLNIIKKASEIPEHFLKGLDLAEVQRFLNKALNAQRGISLGSIIFTKKEECIYKATEYAIRYLDMNGLPVDMLFEDLLLYLFRYWRQMDYELRNLQDKPETANDVETVIIKTVMCKAVKKKYR